MYKFIRVREGTGSTSCQLVGGVDEEELGKEVANFLKLAEGTLLDSWVVPEDLKNATGSDPVGEAFSALLALDTLSDFPVVSDLFATIFEAGYQLAESKEPNSAEGYSVSVDHTLSVEGMVRAGRYEYKESNINSTNFKISGDGIVPVSLRLVHLNMVVSTKQVEAYLEANGLRPATLGELLAFGSTYPDIQLKFSVIALGSSWIDQGRRPCVPFLVRRGSARALFLGWSNHNWPEHCRFLAASR